MPPFARWRSAVAAAAAVVLLAADGSAVHLPTRSLVQPPRDFEGFLSRHDMRFRFERTDGAWQYLPTSWLTGPFVGNGVVGAVAYFCNPPSPANPSRGGLCWHGNATRDAELRVELGRQDLYSSRTPRDDFWAGVRLPVGYARVSTKGRLVSGDLTLSLWGGEVAGTLTTTEGAVSVRLYTHATMPVTVVETNATGGESVSVTFVPLTRCVNRWDVAGLVPCGLRPNPPAECDGTVAAPEGGGGGAETVCRQRMKESEGDKGSFATVVVTDGDPAGAMVTHAMVASALWPHDTNADPRVEAKATVARARALGPAALRASHAAWWHAFWPASFLSVPVTRVEGFYWIEVYKIASSSREGGPMKDEIGPWYVDTEWPGYWYDLNSELTYYPIGASNRVELGRNLGTQFKLNVGNGNLARNVLRTQPAWNGSMSIGASGNQMQVGGQAGDLIWVSSDLWALCEYEYNATCHGDLFLPVLRGAVGVFAHYLTPVVNGTTTPHLHVPDSALPNCGGGGWDNSYDLGAAHWGLGTFVSLCDAIAVRAPPFDAGAVFNATAAAEHCAFRDSAADMLSRLAPLAVSEAGIDAARGNPFVQPCRHFDHLLPCNPWQMYPSWNATAPPAGGVASDTVCRRTVDQFYSVTWGGHAECTFSYPPVSQMSASVGRGDAAWGNITAVTDWVTSIMPNTMDNEGDPVPSARQIVNIDPCATAALADSVQYMMLQSHNQRIQVFPAVPQAWSRGAVFWRLRAMRAFLVSAELSGGGSGTLSWLQLESLSGAQPVVVAAPFAVGVAELAVDTLPPGANVTLEEVNGGGGGGASSDGRTVVFRVLGFEAGMTVLIGPSHAVVVGAAPPSVTPVEPNASELSYWGYHPDSPRSRAFAACCGG